MASQFGTLRTMLVHAIQYEEHNTFGNFAKSKSLHDKIAETCEGM